jgi:branched-chain amino acid transport system substrate-binding protein
MKPVTTMVCAAGLWSGVLAGPALAQQTATPLKIGVLSDFSSVYSDIGGMGNVEATRMAIEDFGGSIFGKPIELVTADVLNKPDIAAAIARKWYENESVIVLRFSRQGKR